MTPRSLDRRHVLRALLLGAGAGVFLPARAWAIAEGKPAPPFAATLFDGRPFSLADARGKVVLVNFWASWCNVCKTEKPALDAMAKDLSSDNFEVIALASDRSWTDVLFALVDALVPTFVMPETGSDATADQELTAAIDGYGQALPDGIPFQVLLDPPAGDGNIGKIAASWGIKAVPESALIDRQGNLRAYFVNKRDWQSPVAETCLRSLIDEQ
jgi:thiol-disulfide isomerase/thioredoxin